MLILKKKITQPRAGLVVISGKIQRKIGIVLLVLNLTKGTNEKCDFHISLKEGSGVILYLRQEGRGIGLLNKLRAYKLQEDGFDTVEANHKLGFKMDNRDYGIGAQILRDIGVKNIRLISNNPKKRTGLIGYGLEIVESVGIEITPNEHNIRYLTTKRDKMGHDILKHH